MVVRASKVKSGLTITRAFTTAVIAGLVPATPITGHGRAI